MLGIASARAVALLAVSPNWLMRALALCRMSLSAINRPCPFSRILERSLKTDNTYRVTSHDRHTIDGLAL